MKQYLKRLKREMQRLTRAPRDPRVDALIRTFDRFPPPLELFGAAALRQVDELKTALDRWVSRFQQERKALVELWESPTLREHLARTAATVERARRGDRSSLVEVVAQFGVGIFSDSDVLIAVEQLDPSDVNDRATLDKIAKALRSTLLPPRRRRAPQYWHEVIKLIPLVQAAYETHRGRLKSHYRNPAARHLDIAEVSRQIGRAVPVAYRETITAAAQSQLESSKRWPRRRFGVNVVAAAFRRSSRQVGSIRLGR